MKSNTLNLKKLKNIFVCFSIIGTLNIFADIHYVSKTGANVSPFTSWANAATNIQDSVDVASEGDVVLVNDGIYNFGGGVIPGFSSSNRVVITENITVKSENGSDNTIILGKGPLGNLAVRGVYISAGILEGFTVSNGHTWTSWDNPYDPNGGGVNMYGGNGILTNCKVIGNRADKRGGGTYDGRINNCTISGNSAVYGGGTMDGIINNCIISGNSATDIGGGTYSGTVNNCTINANFANFGGGGTYASTLTDSTISKNNTGSDGGGTYEGIVNNCTISWNTTGNSGGGTYNSIVTNSTINRNLANKNGGGTCEGSINNCVIINNSAENSGGGTCKGTINNCTISGNTAENFGGGTDDSVVNNSIIWDNSAIKTIFSNHYSGPIRYSCTEPLPDGGWDGNISADPQFISALDLRLNQTSPCIDSGTNAFAPMPYDLDDNPRIIEEIVDMGAYEFVPEPCFVFITYLFVIYIKKQRLYN